MVSRALIRFCLAAVAGAACDGVGAPAASTGRPRLEGRSIVRFPDDPALRAKGYYLVRGERVPGGGCRWPVMESVALGLGEFRMEWEVESDPLTCRMLIAWTDEPPVREEHRDAAGMEERVEPMVETSSRATARRP